MLDILGEPRQEAETCIDDLERRNGFVTPIALGRSTDEGCQLRRMKRRSTTQRVPRGRKRDAIALFDKRAAFLGLVVTAHNAL